MSTRTSEGLVLSASLHALVALVLWFGYVTREKTAAIMQTLTLVSQDGEKLDAVYSSHGFSQSAAAAGDSTPLKASLAQTIRQSRNSKIAQLTEEGRQRQTTVAQAAAEPQISSNTTTPAKSARTITKEQFDHQNPATRVPLAQARSAGVVHINPDTLVRELRDGAGVGLGIQNGSSVQAKTDAASAFGDLVRAQIRAALDEQPGIVAGLIAEVEIHILPDGTVHDIQILRSSGDSSFDDAVHEALARLKLPPRPDGIAEVQRFPIRSQRR